MEENQEREVNALEEPKETGVFHSRSPHDSNIVGPEG